jgi:hypothetical protein
MPSARKAFDLAGEEGLEVERDDFEAGLLPIETPAPAR